MEWAAYFDERTETMPPAWTRRLEEELLTDQVTRCYERSPFYRRKLAEGGVRPEHVLSAEDLRRIPFTTKEELRASQEAEPPLGDFACVDLVDVVRVHLTSGTTGKPLVLGYTPEDRARPPASAPARSGQPARGPTTCSCTASTTASTRAGSPTTTAWRRRARRWSRSGSARASACSSSGRSCVRRRSSRRSPIRSTWRRPRRTRVVDPRGLGLRKLIVAGEPGGQLDGTRRRLEELWGAELADTYGLSDVWATFAAECEERDGLHFSGQDAVLVELIEPESGDPVEIEPGASGELVFTHLAREASPVLRFRSRDLAEILGVECPCGRTGFRFRVAGRSDDMFRVRGVNVFPSSLEGLCASAGSTASRSCSTASPSSRRWRSSPRAPTARRRSWPKAVRAALQFTCVVRAATLPRSEGKSKRLYRVYDGEERP